MVTCNNCEERNIPENANYCPKCGNLLSTCELKEIYALINYNEACKKLFDKHFKYQSYSFGDIISVAGKLYHDKNVLDFVVGYCKDDRFDSISVWKITEMILEKYKLLETLEKETVESLAGKIGNAITHS